MQIFDVVLNTDALTVLAPPNTIDLSVDFGPQGERGSRVFVGSGDPNDTGVLSSAETPQAYDLFINTSTASQYSWLYQYISKPAGFSWDPVLKLQPSMYSKTTEATFSTGTSTIAIPLADIISDVSVSDVDRYVVQVTPIYSSPIALSINSKTIVSTNFQIVIEGIEYTSSTWSELSGTLDLQITITVV
jgi:hypothetical protein